MHLEPAELAQQRSRRSAARDPSSMSPRDAQPTTTDLDQKIFAALRRKNPPGYVQLSGPGRDSHTGYCILISRASRVRERPERAERTPQESSASSSAVQCTSSSTLLAPSRPDRSPRVSSALPSSSRQAMSPRRAAVATPRQAVEADHEEFSRRLRISSHSPRLGSSSHSKSAISKLYNPDSDSLPIRRTAEPEQLSDVTGSSHAHGSRSQATPQHREERSGGSRQLFDHRKDDPVRFAVLTRPNASSSSHRPTPNPKYSGDHMSASSASSYAPSISSSTFTLSSTTDGSSASSALFDRPSQATDDSASSALSKKLKRLYRVITDLETKVKQQEAAGDMDEGNTSRVLLTGKEVVNTDADKEKWQRRVADHKECVVVTFPIMLY